MRTLRTAKPVIDDALHDALGHVPAYALAWGRWDAPSSRYTLAHAALRYPLGSQRGVPPARATIRLNIRLWAYLSDAQKRSTLRHEAMHVAAAYAFGIEASTTANGHGSQWKAFMTKIGEPPIACYSPEVKRYVDVILHATARAYTCACRTRLALERERYMRHGYCPLCRQPVTLADRPKPKPERILRCTQS